VTVCWKSKYLIVMNSAHPATRQSSSLMHELAHLIIGHKPARLDVTPDGMMILSTYDKQNEEEANWLAATLLLPREALFNAPLGHEPRGHGQALRGAARRWSRFASLRRAWTSSSGAQGSTKGSRAPLFGCLRSTAC
jgi:Zn-dependent peptidase ImmA (M78 family)